MYSLYCFYLFFKSVHAYILSRMCASTGLEKRRIGSLKFHKESFIQCNLALHFRSCFLHSIISPSSFYMLKGCLVLLQKNCSIVTVCKSLTPTHKQMTKDYPIKEMSVK